MRERLLRGCEAVAAAAFGLLFLTFVFQVVMRFVFNKPLAWSDELIVVLYIFVVFWSAATLIKEKEHALLTAGLLLYALPASFDYVKFMHREKTPVLDIPFSYVFAPFVFFVAVIGLQYVLKFCRLLGKDWQKNL